jgi:hypothetical protein
MEHPHHINFVGYVDSKDRLSGTTSNFTSIIDLPPNDFNRVCLLQASIPKSWYLFDSTNNTFTLQENTSTTTITIPVGNYNRVSFGVILQSLLNTASQLLGGINFNTYTITYPNKTLQTDNNKYTFSYTTMGTARTASFIFSNNYCGPCFGFNNGSTNPFVTQSLVSVNAINLASKTRLFLKSNVCSLANQQILQEIFSSSVQDNSIVTYQQNEIDANSKLFLAQDDNAFSFQICDRFNKVIDLNGLDMVISLYFYRFDDTNQYIKNDIILRNIQ